MPETVRETPTNFRDLRQDRELFKRYLENPYPVREVAYRYVSQHVTSQTATNIVLVAHGSLQDGTFFHQYVDVSGHPGVRWNSEVCGQARDGANWFLDAKAALGIGGRVQIAVPGASAYTRASSKSAEGLLQLRCACWFGLRMLVPGSVTWDGDTFAAEWFNSHWPQDTNSVPVKGEILGFTNNLPLAIRLSSKHWPKAYRYVVVHLEYDPTLTNQFYPTKLWTEAVLEQGVVQGQVLEDIRIEFGDNAVPEGGYKPADFLPTAVSQPPMLLLASNVSVYWAQGGKLTEVGTAVPPHSPMLRSVVKWGIRAAFVCSLLPLIVLIRAISRRTSSGYKQT